MPRTVSPPEAVAVAWRRRAALLALAVLGACAAPPPTPDPASTDPGAAVLYWPPPPVDMIAGPFKTEELIGMTGAEVGGALGPPALVRREPPAELWQWVARSCVLDVVLYADAGVLTVAHAESRARLEDVRHDPATCLTEVRTAGVRPIRREPLVETTQTR